MCIVCIGCGLFEYETSDEKRIKSPYENLNWGDAYARESYYRRYSYNSFSNSSEDMSYGYSEDENESNSIYSSSFYSDRT